MFLEKFEKELIEKKKPDDEIEIKYVRIINGTEKNFKN